MNSRLIYFIFGILLILPLVTSASFTFKQNDVINYKFRCIDTTNYYCVNTTQLLINIDFADNGTNIINNLSMTGTNLYFNVTLPTKFIGDYNVLILSPTASNSTTEFTYRVTYTGDELSSSQTWIYILGLVFLIIIILGLFVMKEHLPKYDSMDEYGTILEINQLKHFRGVIWIIIWILTLAIIYITSSIAIAYLNSLLLGNLFFVLFRLMFLFTIIGVPVYIIYLFYKVWRDKEFQRMITRGAELQGSKYI